MKQGTVLCLTVNETRNRRLSYCSETRNRPLSYYESETLSLRFGAARAITNDLCSVGFAVLS